MDELIELVSKKAGIPKQSAKVAVDTVVTFLKQKLPEPLSGQLDNLLTGSGTQDLLKGLGDLLGK